MYSDINLPPDRDLKPENILLSDKTSAAALKVIDFGTSDFCLPGQRLSQKFGTPYYVAPVSPPNERQSWTSKSEVSLYLVISQCRKSLRKTMTNQRIFGVQESLCTFFSVDTLPLEGRQM